MAGIESLTFDLTGCSLREQSRSHRGWMNAAHVAHMLRFHLGPPDWPFDLTKPAEAGELYRKQCADNGGVMLAMEITTAAGVEALRGLFKYRAPVPRSLAMYYVGILWLPFQECLFQVNIEAMEAGTTGTREAAVMLIEGDRWPKPPADTPPVVLQSAEELFKRLGSAPVRQLPSDDERYDALVPDHPLSQVRARLTDVVASAQFEPHTGRLTPFRVQRGRR
ncbi:MAG: hypothetical protein U0441_31060 [Polyangiaceae bacterium]